MMHNMANVSQSFTVLVFVLEPSCVQVQISNVDLFLVWIVLAHKMRIVFVLLYTFIGGDRSTSNMKSLFNTKPSFQKPPERSLTRQLAFQPEKPVKSHHLNITSEIRNRPVGCLIFASLVLFMTVEAAFFAAGERLDERMRVYFEQRNVTRMYVHRQCVCASIVVQ